MRMAALVGALALASGASAQIGVAASGAGDRVGVSPVLLLPRPPASGSPEQRRELEQVRAAIAAASPAEIAQAAADDAREDPSLFDQLVTPGSSLRRLPATWRLLTEVQRQGDATVDAAKVAFGRTRPWGDDPALPTCVSVQGKKPTRSYPSGHAMVGWTVGLVLAELLPAQASDILARARGYAQERVACGEHYPSDIEASHVLAAIVVTRLEDQPAFQAELRAARAELDESGPAQSKPSAGNQTVR